MWIEFRQIIALAWFGSLGLHELTQLNTGAFTKRTFLFQLSLLKGFVNENAWKSLLVNRKEILEILFKVVQTNKKMNSVIINASYLLK